MGIAKNLMTNIVLPLAFSLVSAFWLIEDNLKQEKENENF